MSAIEWLSIAVVPGILAATLIILLRRSPLAAAFADVPNERSLHESPTPRLGGIALMTAMFPFAAWHSDPPLAIVLSCSLFLALVSLADDYRSLPIQVRLPAHFAAACTVVYATFHAGFSGVEVVEATLAVIAIVWMTNLYNFMDGSDGLAGGMALFGFAALAAGAAITGHAPVAAACVAIASAACGFLLQNFPPAKVFLGDAGSVPLGFLAGALGWLGWMAGAWPAWFPALAFAPFLVDATLTLCVARRARRALLEGPPHARLPTPGARGMVAPAPRPLGLCADGRWACRGARRLGFRACGAGAYNRRHRGGVCRALRCDCASPADNKKKRQLAARWRFEDWG